MDIGEKVNQIWNSAKQSVFIPETKSEITDYMMGKTLNNYFEELPEEKRSTYQAILEGKIDSALKKYESSLKSVASKWGGVAGKATAGSQIFAFLTGASASAIPYAAVGVIGAKTAMELPALYNYMGNAKDLNGVYGLVKYGLKKALGLTFPIVAGPLIEGNALKKMLVERVIYEAKKDFLGEVSKDYHPMKDLVKQRVEQVAGPLSTANAYSG